MSVVNIKDVTRIYKQGEMETCALRGVSLEIEKGGFYALVGPSGSGKTTLLQMIGCLDKPNTGKILIDGLDVTNLNASKRADLRRGTIGFVFQFFALVPGLNAYENVELPLLLIGEKKKIRRERVHELLDSVGLDHRADHRPDQLSGGEQQRVAVARALATNPLLVLADEPTANLDTENGRQVMEIMLKLNQDTNTTFIFATHDPRVFHYAGDVIKMRDGKIVDGNNNFGGLN